MERIGVFDVFKVGVGPSSSHTMGPWRAAARFVRGLADVQVRRVGCRLYGSLAKTGKGHGTDFALICGLSGLDPETCDPAYVPSLVARVRENGKLELGGLRTVECDPALHLEFFQRETLPEHPNGMSFWAECDDGETYERTFFSVGGGFVIERGVDEIEDDRTSPPYEFETAAEVEAHCSGEGIDLIELAWRNELAWRRPDEARTRLRWIWRTMVESVHRGVTTEGRLPGGLQVARRAPALCRSLSERTTAVQTDEWLGDLRAIRPSFEQRLRWMSAFAMAVNEENAAFGRVVTAPTNGAAGVIPSVLLAEWAFGEPRGRPDLDLEAASSFLLVAAVVGALFKRRATISAAMGGCQAEIGVSSAMAAAALCAVRGGSVARCFMAAEIAMEHHLGMTCDPIGGLVQVPCIERNTMGAAKAVVAAELALSGEPDDARVRLDDVIQTMWETALDMNSKYKETSEGGLAKIPVNLAEC